MVSGGNAEEASNGPATPSRNTKGSYRIPNIMRGIMSNSSLSSLRLALMAETILVSGALCVPAAAQSPVKSVGIEEVVVTTQRRTEKLQDVPVSVAVLTGADLAKNGVADISRFEMLSPSFTFGRTGHGAITPTRTQSR